MITMKSAVIAVLALAVLSFSNAEDDGQYRPGQYGGDDGSYRRNNEGQYLGVRNGYKVYTAFDNAYKSLIAGNGKYSPIYSTVQPVYVKAYNPYQQQLLTPYVNYGGESSFDQDPFGTSLAGVTYRPPVVPLVSTVSPVVYASTPKPIVYTASSVDPIVFAGSTPKPFVYTASTPKPVIYAASTPKPVIYAASTPKPVIYAASTPKPVIYAASTPKPVVYAASTPKAVVFSASTSKPFVYTAAANVPYPVYAKSYANGYARIIKQDQDVDANSYRYSYETENGINAGESGVVDSVHGGGTKAAGFYEYIGDDGLKYRVDYTADENGFRPSGAHLP